MSQFNPTANNIPPVSGVSSVDSSTLITIRIDPTTKRLLVDAGSITTSSASDGIIGNAVPASASYGGINVSGTLRGITGVNSSGSIYSPQMDLASVGGTTFGLGQQLAATSLPVVLTAAQITTLTPLSSVTANAGTNLNTSLLALESGGNLASIAGTVSTTGSAKPSKGLLVSGQDGTNAYPLLIDRYGKLISRSESILGDQLVGIHRNQVEVDFSNAFDSAIITNTTSGSGAATQGSGKATYATGATTTGEAKGVTVQTILYRPGTDAYAYFTAAFTTPDNASSYQRIGPYNTTDGFFIGYEGTTFKATVRQNSSDTGTAQASFSNDLLTGAAGSKFTRGGSPEAIDWTKLNVFRIRYSWFGAAPIQFEVLSPDGTWVVFHRIAQPNTSSGPSIFVTNLPITVDSQKSSASTTNLIISTACVAGGTTDPAIKITDTIVDSTLAEVTRSVLVGHTTAAGGSYVNVKVDPSGTLTTSVGNAGGASAVNIQDGGNSITVDGSITADTELPSAAALADTASATPTTPTVGSIPLLMNASSVDRQRAVINSLDSTGIGIAAAGLVGQLDDSGTSTVTENQFSTVRISSRRALLVEGVSSGTALPVSGTVTANQGTAGSAEWQVGGGIASGVADSGNPVKVGGKYNSTKPTFTDGQRGDLQIGTRGSVAVSLYVADSNQSVRYLNDNSDAAATTGTAQHLTVASRNYVLNPVATPVWDRQYTVTNATNSTGTGITAVGLVAQLDDTSPTTITENQFGNVRMSSTRALYSEPGPFLNGRVTADGQIKASAGFIHTITISPTTTTPTAGLITVYDNTAESGTILYTEWVRDTLNAHTIILDIPAGTGIYVGYDAAVTNCSVNVSYR